MDLSLVRRALRYPTHFRLSSMTRDEWMESIRKEAEDDPEAAVYYSIMLAIQGLAMQQLPREGNTQQHDQVARIVGREHLRVVPVEEIFCTPDQ